MTPPVDTAKLRELMAKATPVGWTVSDDNPGDVVLYGPDENWLANIGNWARQAEHASELDADATARQACEFRDAADAALIVAAVNALPALLDELDASRAVVEAARFNHFAHEKRYLADGFTSVHHEECEACRLDAAVTALDRARGGQ